MGQEITSSQFSAEDFNEFAERLERETRLLDEWVREGGFPASEHLAGFELESWLVDSNARPSPINDILLDRLMDPLVVPELARFNLEVNSTPLPLQDCVLSRLADELRHTWSRCRKQAGEFDARLAMIGILPTVRVEDLVAGNMSGMQRYQALDDQLGLLRGGEPLQIDLRGREQLLFSHENVMLEAVTTSFQIHLQVEAERAGRFYNASKMISGPMVALSANSPYLFGVDLWDETRIPLFEQAVQVADGQGSPRVTLGRGYVDSITDCFWTNFEDYPVLLPELMDEHERLLPHLRLHNGTIWRWNRPLVGFDERCEPHIRIEHRVVPAGPTVEDAIANAAFYFGCVSALTALCDTPEVRLPFVVAWRNFYQAARHGLRARVEWMDGAQGDVASLLSSRLLPMAADGLIALGVDREEAAGWLGVLSRRVESGQNGAVWQRAWVAAHGRDMAGLTEAYFERQESGHPVHEWTV